MATGSGTCARRDVRVLTAVIRGAVCRLLLVATLLAVGLSVAPLVVPDAVAAAPELQITADARYDVRPDRARVHVTLDATITNTHIDAAGVRTYYDTGYLAVLPGSANFEVTSPGAKPTVSIRSQTRSYTLLTIKLGRRLYAGRHTPLQLQFDLPDKGGTALRDVRVGTSLIAFPVWAFATTDTPGGSVSVVFPPGYNVQQQVGVLPPPVDGPGGSVVYTSGSLAKPLAFYAYFIADRPGAFTETRLAARVGTSDVPIVIRAWSDDRAWGTRIGSLVRRGLPALGAAIGLPYRGTGLVVQESVSRTIGGYAGIFDPVAGTIQVAYYAGPFVVLHEAAHAWLNGRLAAERWILEGFASWYAAQAGASMKIPVSPPKLTADLRAAKIPLNDWPGVGRADEATEDYAYAATYELARLIASRAGAAGLRAVWQAAAAGEQPYQPFHAGAAPEQGASPPDWRGLLDLLEERTSAKFADLWTKWVVRGSDAPLIVDRAKARAAYASAVVEAGDWELPAGIRRAMSGWQFPEATALIVGARAVLQKRAAIASATEAAGLTVPPTLRTAFEGSDRPDEAAAEADRELHTIDLVVVAQEAGTGVGGVLAQIGLLDQAPEVDMAAARSAFAGGDMAAAQARAAAARSTWESADGRGRQRLLIAGAVVAGVLLLLVAAAMVVRRRQPRGGDSSA
jgi:hypothetical protein